MRAIGYAGSTSPADPRPLVDVDLPLPQPRSRDLLVRVDALAVNPVDLKVRQRESPPPGQWRVLGWDATGRVDGVGDGVEGFQLGDRVWYAGALDRPGCNSEWHLVDERLVALAPRNLSDAEAAALPLTSITAWELLFDRLKLRPESTAHQGEVLLVVGAAGGVGSILIQLAMALTGITVVATASRPESERWLRELGVSWVINHGQPLLPQLQALGFDGAGRVVSLTHTAQHFDALFELLHPQGAMALIDDPDPSAINVLALKRKSLSLHWELMFTRSLYGTPDMAQQGRILQQVSQLVEQGLIRTTLQRQLAPIAAATLEEAHALQRSQRMVGKVVVAGW
ncbi:MAG: zinc-binding alcohol dehydrogenase family protein [Vulcanococcus sp.]